MDTGIDGVDRKQRRQLCHSGGRLAVDLLFEAPVPIRHSEPPRRSIEAGLAEHGKSRSPVPDEPAHLARPERPPSPQHEYALEQTRLAGAIGAENVVPPG